LTNVAAFARRGQELCYEILTLCCHREQMVKSDAAAGVNTFTGDEMLMTAAKKFKIDLLLAK
jgi:hypothetical protein